MRISSQKNDPGFAAYQREKGRRGTHPRVVQVTLDGESIDSAALVTADDDIGLVKMFRKDGYGRFVLDPQMMPVVDTKYGVVKINWSYEQKLSWI